ncbi:MAG: RIP metalloprotease RseP [Chitinivibrionales bacterium]|nr:RIP metalloprotease RseP [Chitinivibrionales bacterium]
MLLLLQIIIGIFVLGVLVLLHELGHFLAAKSFKIRVITFSIGFGKPLFRKTYGQTEYRLSAIPFGGFVHMAGEQPEEGRSPAPDDFTSKPVWQRACVAAAGPVANMISSIFFLWLVYIIGVPHDTYLDNTTIGTVDRSSPAWQAGIEPGDSILAVNGKKVADWNEIGDLFSRQDKTYTVLFMRKGIEYTKTIQMPFIDERLPTSVTAGMQPSYPPVVGSISPQSAAQRSGFKPNDTIVKIDTTDIYSWIQVSTLISAFDTTQPGITFEIKRDGAPLTLQTKPDYNYQEKRFMLGIGPAQSKTRTVSYPPRQAVDLALAKTWDYTTMIFDVLSKLFNKTISAKQLSGPIGIIQMSGVVALGSFVSLLNFIALIGINLAVINLFPLIITDGGVLLFLLIEAVRRKPLPISAQMLLNKIAIAFFIMLFLFVTFNDIIRIPAFLK